MQFSKKENLRLFLFIVLLFFLFNLNINSVPGQEKLQKEVTVTALEVPVRVIHKGQMVKGLTQEDFEIYENGVKQEITAFEAITRKISTPQEERKAHQKKRLFVLIFNIFDYNEAVGEGIDYFFQNIFQQGDQFIVLTEGRLLDIKRGINLAEIILNLKETLKKFKIISNQSTLKVFRDLKFESDRLLGILQGYGRNAIMSMDQAMVRFFDNYKIAWFDYRKRYLIPNLELYRNIIKRIKQREGERWAICFQQREIFPQLKKAGRLDNEIRNWVDSQVDAMAQVKARIVQVKQQELQSTFDVSQNFPADGLRDLFIEANITFHLILLKSFRTVFSRDFELREITSGYEDCFKRISLSTGGSSVFSNKVSEALEEVKEKEEKKRDIEIKVKKSGVDIVYLKRIPEKGEPLITVTNFNDSKKNIKFSLINYTMTKIEGKLTGVADIKITIYDENSNKVFDERKTLNLIKKETHISLNFNWLKSGSYFIIIQVSDRISQETDVFSRDIKF